MFEGKRITLWEEILQDMVRNTDIAPYRDDVKIIKRDDVLSLSSTHHMAIPLKTKDIDEVLYDLRRTVMNQWNRYELRDAM